MTNNEKVAHDLALIYIKKLISKDIVEISSSDELDIGLFTDEYLNIYSHILANLEHHSQQN